MSRAGESGSVLWRVVARSAVTVALALGVLFCSAAPGVFAESAPATGLSSEVIAPSPKILVGLFRASGFTLSSDDELALSVKSGGSTAVIKVPAGALINLTISGTSISWELAGSGSASKKGSSKGPVLVGPPVVEDAEQGEAGGDAEAAPSPLITVERQTAASANFAGASFRGSIIIVPPSGSPPGGLLAANVVDIEDYIASVVGGEIPDGWPIECLRAQAVTARTFAAYKTGLTSAGASVDYEKDFDTVVSASVFIWASDQVYRGVSEENPESRPATLDTRGTVLVYDGRAVAAYFHSDAGGMTEDPRYVWGGSMPCLEPVREIPHNSPYSFWTVTLDENSLASGLDKLGIDLGTPPALIEGYQPGGSGRWTGVTVPAATGAAGVRATSFRSAFPQVKSMLFSSFGYGGGDPTRGQIGSEMDVYAQSGDTAAPPVLVTVGSSVVLGAGGATAENPNGAFALSGKVEQSPLTYVIQGKGWGHGVGLSQYGAREMALEGQDAQVIVTTYFPGASIEKWW